MIGAHHVPRRIPDDDVEPAVWLPPATSVEEDFWEFELPMKEPMFTGRAMRDLQELVRLRVRQRAASGEDGVGKCGKEARTRAKVGGEPASAPQIGDPLPSRQRAIAVHERSKCTFLRAHVLWCVVGFARQRKSNRQHLAKGVADRKLVEQWLRVPVRASVGWRLTQAR